jgi:class I fructose-bisphosphate aldolase
MSIGKKIRLNRLFSHPSGRLCSIAVDHFIGYGEGIPPGLAHIRQTLAAIVAGRPDAVTMHRGIAASAWEPFAGAVPFILQSTIARPDDSACEQIAEPEDAVRLGADAFAVAAFVRGPTEAAQLKTVAECVKAALRFEMPVIVHIYPRDYTKGVTISFRADDVAWAVRCAMECGVDVVKVPFCNDTRAYGQIVADCTVPLVAAGGPKCETFEAALAMLGEVVRSGARGATIGRNVWGCDRITEAVRAAKAVIHEQKSPREALATAGLT